MSSDSIENLRAATHQASDPDGMVSETESNVDGSRLKGSLHVMIVVACAAGKRSVRATLVRLGRVTVGSALSLAILTL